MVEQGNEQPQHQPDGRRAARDKRFLLQAQAAQKVLDLIEALAQVFKLLSKFHRRDAKIAEVFHACPRPVQNCMFEICWYACTILFRTCIIS